MEEAKIRFALTGCGYIGKRYIEILAQHPQAELAAIIDIQKICLPRFTNKTVPFFPSLEAFLSSDVHADVVIIATPNGAHAPLAIEALKHGKHVLIEKPMALKRKDAHAVIATSKQVDRKVMVVLQNRFSPVSVWLKELIDSNRLGKLFFVEVNCFWNRDERYYTNGSWHGTANMDGGSLFTQFSHFVDALYWFFGDIKNIQSRFANFNHQHCIEFEDTGSMVFDFEAGGMGSFNFSTAAWDATVESSLTILAENGSIKIGGQYMDKILYCHVRNYDSPEIKSADSFVNHRKMIDEMIRVLVKNGSTNAEEALVSVDIIERMYESSSHQMF